MPCTVKNKILCIVSKKKEITLLIIIGYWTHLGLYRILFFFTFKWLQLFSGAENDYSVLNYMTTYLAN